MKIRITLRQLECFVAVAEERSFRAAAERLHMTQPPLSRQIGQLETELGVELLKRDSQGTALTAAGNTFLSEARKILRQAAKAVTRIQQSTDGMPRLKVGYTTVFDPDVFPALEPAFRKRVPNASLELSTNISVELIRRLRRGALDVAFVGLPSETGELIVELLHKESLVAVVPAGNPIARRKILSLSDLEPYPFFWPARRINPGFFDHYQDVFERLGFAPERRLPEPKDHHLLLAEVARGRGIGLIPASMKRLRREGTVFKTLREKELWIGFGIAYRQGTRPPGLDTFLRLARQKLKT